MAANEADRNKLHQICELSYKAQAVWFLNGFWDSHQGEAEKFWAYVNKANAIDIEKHEAGCALDELNAHRLLEMFDETLTVREMRTQLRSVGAIGEKEHPKLVPLAHLLLARYKVDWHHFVNAPQGDQEEINRAQAQLDACKAAFEESNARAAEAAEALRQAETAEASAKSREAAAKASAEEAARREAASKAAAADLAAKEAELRAAQAELDAALAEVQKEEDAYNAKTADLKAKSETGGTVSMNRAKNELAQHLAGETLPLKKAKITAEAAAKRNERAVNAAAASRQVAEAAAREATAARQAADADAREATAARQAAEQAAAQATAARQEAERRRHASAEAKAAADAALARAEAALAEAEAFLEEVKKTAGGGKGALWWIERELHEQKKYLPTSRGGIAKH